MHRIIIRIKIDGKITSDCERDPWEVEGCGSPPAQEHWVTEVYLGDSASSQAGGWMEEGAGVMPVP